MKIRRSITVLAATAAIALLPASAGLAQRQPPSPEQRIDRIERQLQQVQRQVFPRGAPAATAGFSDDPAATQSSVVRLDQRLDALERQMSDILRLSEENGHRLRTMEADNARARTDQDQRLATIEQRLREAAAVPAAADPLQPGGSRPQPANPSPKPATPGPSASDNGSAASGSATDAGEDAYSEGFRLWDGGSYDAAITALRAFTSAYPKHRRVSFANNLIGRAMLDKGEPRAAAEALLANYRNNPTGERAADSLFYLGQALMQLGQPGQACKAYAELKAVYGSKVRADLRKQVEEAESKAQCG